MCYIIFAPRGAKIDLNWLILAADTNPDGFGVAYFRDGKLRYFKSMDLESFLEEVRKIPMDEIWENKKALQSWIGHSKLVIMEDDETIILNEKLGVWKDGCWHSSWFVW